MKYTSIALLASIGLVRANECSLVAPACPGAKTGETCVMKTVLGCRSERRRLNALKRDPSLEVGASTWSCKSKDETDSLIGAVQVDNFSSCTIKFTAIPEDF